MHALIGAVGTRQRLVQLFRERGASEVSELKTVDEDVRFMLPTQIRRQLAARAESGTGLPVVG